MVVLSALGIYKVKYKQLKQASNLQKLTNHGLGLREIVKRIQFISKQMAIVSLISTNKKENLKTSPILTLIGVV